MLPPGHVLSVTEVTRAVRDVIEGVVGEVWVEGEIGNYRKQASGHQYFTLKDDRCQLSCVLFQRPGLWRSVPTLAEGMQVQVKGTMTVYEARGQYQLNVAQVQVAGEGMLAAKFEALKRKLAAEGFFDRERKQLLPRFPRTIGIVTSPTGAVIRDMIEILRRRAPWIRVVVYPVRVQGAGAAVEIAAAVAEFNRGVVPGVEVVVVARGGGSAEDLWEFNEEVVARAIAASRLPVVSAVGHEIDFSIADFVADLRAPTPSAAAELIAPDTAELLRALAQTRLMMERRARDRIARERAQLGFMERSVLFREPQARIEALMQTVDGASAAMDREVRRRLEGSLLKVGRLEGQLREMRPALQIARYRHRLEELGQRMRGELDARRQREGLRVAQLASLLRVLNPRSVLGRGYSMTRNERGELVRSLKDAPMGTMLTVEVVDGTLRAKVTDNR